jgi:predicted signal transduction protein with EAL and GGDEF domain
LISLAPRITDRITVSIGIASAPHQAHDRVTLLRLADEALYRAKADGRNRVVCAGEEQTADAAVQALPDQLTPTLVSPAVSRRRSRSRARAAS